jgi:uncharacterized membrane protein (GlpM family)
VRPRERLKRAAIDFGLDAVLALHPRLWAWYQRDRRRWREMPLAKKLVWMVGAWALLAAFAVYAERKQEQLRGEVP